MAIGFAMLVGSAKDVSANQEIENQALNVLETRCVRCHSGKEPDGELDLSTRESIVRGGANGAAVTPGNPDESLLWDYVTGDEPEMPQGDEPLAPHELRAVHDWIAAGARWDGDRVLRYDRRSWWSLQPIQRPHVPWADSENVANPIDAFVEHRRRQQGLTAAPEADRRTLLRRLSIDLLGIPPAPEDVRRFEADRSPDAYEKVVERLLASPRYGERWARHWLDVVHYGETHGYDKDKPRPNAWPYRDYVIRSLNADKSWSRFVREQVAGDVLYPGTRDGIEALGFVAAGPWDFIGHAEVPETKIDGRIARHLDRDDMVTNTFNSFLSLTVQCARCHDHKFDAIAMDDYYSLHAVFAAVDRADKFYDVDPQKAARRSTLAARVAHLNRENVAFEEEIRRKAGPEIAAIDKDLDAFLKTKENRPEFGYHSQIVADQNLHKWVQLDFGASVPLATLIYVGCHDDFNNIGAGFGFPRRFKIEVSDDAAFKTGVRLVVDRTSADVANPGVYPQVASLDGTARYLRFTATKLATRQNDYILALSELIVLSPEGNNMARAAKVTALDSIEAPVRWGKANIIDGYFPSRPFTEDEPRELARLLLARQKIMEQVVSPEMARRHDDLIRQTKAAERELAAAPAKNRVYAATVHRGNGAFRGTGHDGGKPRMIRVLHRGNILTPGDEVGPRAPAIVRGNSGEFGLPEDHVEGDRRAALAHWLTHRDHPLTWRSIVNRLWQYHFGQGIVATPNDFGHMGARPTHPLLLDWLAAELRRTQSLKHIHRLIVTSTTYRQSSRGNPTYGERDSDNRFLWRMNRRRLEAEAIRDSVLVVSGRFDDRMYGPSFQDFVVEKPEHSPHYEYHLFDPSDPRCHRRSVYRFIVRSQQQPFMTVLDCADPSQSVATRNESVSAIQALAMLNNDFMLVMAKQFAERLVRDAPSLEDQIQLAFELTLQRPPTDYERKSLRDYIGQFGLANGCRVMFNLNEFAFVD